MWLVSSCHHGHCIRGISLLRRQVCNWKFSFLYRCVKRLFVCQLTHLVCDRKEVYKRFVWANPYWPTWGHSQPDTVLHLNSYATKFTVVHLQLILVISAAVMQYCVAFLFLSCHWGCWGVVVSVICHLLMASPYLLSPMFLTSLPSHPNSREVIGP